MCRCRPVLSAQCSSCNLAQTDGTLSFGVRLLAYMVPCQQSRISWIQLQQRNGTAVEAAQRGNGDDLEA